MHFCVFAICVGVYTSLLFLFDNSRLFLSEVVSEYRADSGVLNQSFKKINPSNNFTSLVLIFLLLDSQLFALLNAV